MSRSRQFEPTTTTTESTSATEPDQTTTRPGEQAPTTTVPLIPKDGSAALPSADGVACYLVGPVLADGRDLMGAKAELNEAWVVSVRSRPESVVSLNRMFNACYNGERTCPGVRDPEGRGQLAIVLDQSVLSAPAVNGADLADDTFTITADFEEQQANDLAELISG